MSHFDKAILCVLEHEGGYVHHPADPGGETNFGICKRSYPALDIKSLTRTSAINIYRADFWRVEYDKMPYEVAAKVFDMAVNMGKYQAHKLLQRAVGVDADGIIGSKTLTAISQLPVKTVLATITLEQKMFYSKLVERKPSSRVFLSGWFKRAEWHPKGENDGVLA